MTDFSIMTGDQICDWLNKHGALGMGYLGPCGWNLPACAFAARDWCKKEDVLDSWSDIVQDSVGDAGIATPLDWLVAAAKVVEDNLKNGENHDA